MEQTERFKFRVWDDKINKYYDPLDVDANGFRARLKDKIITSTCSLMI